MILINISWQWLAYCLYMYVCLLITDFYYFPLFFINHVTLSISNSSPNNNFQ